MLPIFETWCYDVVEIVSSKKNFRCLKIDLRMRVGIVRYLGLTRPTH
jgi:hypothetical protein